MSRENDDIIKFPHTICSKYIYHIYSYHFFNIIMKIILKRCLLFGITITILVSTRQRHRYSVVSMIMYTLLFDMQYYYIFLCFMVTMYTQFKYIFNPQSLVSICFVSLSVYFSINSAKATDKIVSKTSSIEIGNMINILFLRTNVTVFNSEQVYL